MKINNLDQLNIIEIKDLEIYGYHGCSEEEKKLGQMFLISVQLYLDSNFDAKLDDFKKTICYFEVCNDIENIFIKNKYNLIEKIADVISEFILTKYYPIIEFVKVKVKKPHASIGKSFLHVAVEVKRAWHTVFIGIGSNLGDREKNICSSIEMINISSSKVVKKSSIIETEPIGIDTQSKFLNCVVEVKTFIAPKEFMQFLLVIEKKIGRIRKEKMESRVIDLDVLFYDDSVFILDGIVVPHPLMHKRMFVLEPLCEIAPYFIHPILRKRIFELKSDFIINS
jgi:dihydroneopterin aldolase/2-amino-4-hydroxy-6-hydroxymethyldihydropteridine diphosphokinase